MRIVRLLNGVGRCLIEDFNLLTVEPRVIAEETQNVPLGIPSGSILNGLEITVRDGDDDIVLE